ncbi:Peptidyl-tRNA hydrolase [hydrothermal vent metagenome]|uniref:peptidyl-tRNA hydrolase n=1 Tax=hydrothermal vent metagenome TaxID=652676 RepID=A0A3B0TCS6_9ZZZZ
MHLIVGLGNPGDQYAGHRHNIGAMALDAIARAHGFAPYKKKFNGLFSDGKIAGNRVLLLKPQTYMNRSGDAVGPAVKFYKLEPGDITVIYDELDLAPSKLKVKTGGGTGGHNGLRSINPQIGTEYQRVRLGIGHPGHKDLVSRYVLSNFAKTDRVWLLPLLDAIAQNADLLVTGDAANFMNKVALAMQSLPSATKPGPAKKPSPGSTSTKAQKPNSGPLADMLKKLFNKN